MSKRTTSTLAAALSATLLLSATAPARADFAMPLSAMPWNAPTIETTAPRTPASRMPATRAATDPAPLPCVDAGQPDACRPGTDRQG